jgi:NAD(P)-dependent dehydrogenase (short-subunit alcohol dehydrogenase family)
MKRIIVAGAGGGIGLALTAALSDRPDVAQVYALHRHPVSSTHPKVEWLQADLSDGPEVEAAATHIRASGGIDGLIIATGLLHEADLSPEKSLADLDSTQLLKLYEINAVTPLMLLKACRDLFSDTPAPFACLLSAQVGSIGDNRLGGWYGYRMAKAALNMGVKCAAIELARLPTPPVIVAMHPGTTTTALSYRFVKRRKQPVSTPQHAAKRLLAVIDNLRPENTGAFLNYDGAVLPW